MRRQKTLRQKLNTAWTVTAIIVFTVDGVIWLITGHAPPRLLGVVAMFWAALSALDALDGKGVRHG